MPRPAPLSIGYWTGSEHLPSLDLFNLDLGSVATAASRGGQEADLAGSGALVPASALASGDRALARQGIDLTVHGLFPRAVAQPDPQVRSLSFRVVFGEAEPLEFVAWSFGWQGGAPQPSPSLRVRVPVSPASGLKLTGEVARHPRLALFGSSNAKAERRPFRVELALGAGPGPKLRRGIYVLAMPAAWYGQPRWRGHRMAAVEAASAGPRVQVARRDLLDSGSLDFSYLLLAVEKAGPRAPLSGSLAIA